MIKDITNEENVTKLLVTSSILKPQYQSFSNRPETLGDFLTKLQNNAKSIENKKSSKYSFIDENLKWF